MRVFLTSCPRRIGAGWIGIASAVDVCDGEPVTVSNDAPAQFATGPNTVTWTAVDGKNRSATALQTVTVIDTTKPTFTFVPPDGLRHFLVGRGQGVITATDGSNNVSTAICR